MNQKKLESLIKQGENHTLEFKENYSSSIAREICALANANGGKILLGVDDNGQKKGIKITNKLKSQIHDITRNFDPNLEVALNNIDDILVVNVSEGTNKPYSVNGHFYMRCGANSQQLNRDEVRDFFHSEGLIRFDEKPNSKFKLETDFSDPAYKEFIRKSSISKILDKKTMLENLDLFDNNVMRNAGVLFFCKNIGRFFLHATITCITFQGNERIKILDRKEYDKDLYNNFQNALNYLKEKLSTEYIIRTAGPRVEKLELPQEALREALLNAIAHRDYFATTSIFVEIYSNRIEITNAGGLVKGLDLNELGNKSMPRNRLLFSLMQRMDLVEKAGTGIKRMQKAMKEYKLPSMKIDAKEHWFTVVFDRPKDSYEDRVYEGKSTPQKSSLKSSQKSSQKILLLIKENSSITIEELSNHIGISDRAVKKHLASLKKKGLLRRIGPDKGGHWEVTE
jgi:ATP-dependent DNA helicase RecG